MAAPHDNLTASELETLISGTRSTYYPIMGRLPSSADEPLIRRWLILNGMIESKVLTATPTVLANAYRVGKSYIDKVNADSSRWSKKVAPKGTSSIDIFDDEAKGLLRRDDDLIDWYKPSAGETSLEASPATNPSGSTPIPSARLSEADIARAAATVIRPRLDEAKRELMRFAADEIEKAAQKFALSDKLKDEIRDLAASIAQETGEAFLTKITTEFHETLSRIENAVPKRLEIASHGKILRTLPAEPRHKIFPRVLRALARGQHAYLVGNAGTGKTHMFKQLAQALDQPVTILGQTLTKYEFSGHIGPTGEYVSTLLRKAVEEGHLLCIDEIDMSSAAAIGFLNSLTANRYVAFPDKMVDAHPNFKVVAAANTFGFGATQQFIGRNPLDAASLDRFSYFVCGYDEDLETALFGTGPWVQYVHRVRNAVNQLGLQHIVSMRAIERGLTAIADGETADDVCTEALWRNLTPDQISKIKAIAGEFKVALRPIDEEAA